MYASLHIKACTQICDTTLLLDNEHRHRPHCDRPPPSNQSPSFFPGFIFLINPSIFETPFIVLSYPFTLIVVHCTSCCLILSKSFLGNLTTEQCDFCYSDGFSNDFFSLCYSFCFTFCARNSQGSYIFPL